MAFNINIMRTSVFGGYVRRVWKRDSVRKNELTGRNPIEYGRICRAIEIDLDNWQLDLLIGDAFGRFVSVLTAQIRI
jgi:hypothetical protein